MKILSKKNDKDFSVIIVNYKSEDFLEKCLQSFSALSCGNLTFEIIVVNNDPQTDLSQVEENFPDVKIIHQEKNNGFGAGNNAGAKRACGKNLFFINPDAEVLVLELPRIAELFEKSSRLGVVGLRVLSDQGKTQEWIAGKEMGLWNLFLNNLGIPPSRKVWQSRCPQRADWVSGTAFFVPRKKFWEVGGFDEGFFMYFEDMDFCRRMRLTGCEVLYFPKFLVRHGGGKSYFSQSIQKKDYYRSQERYFSKHKKKVSYLIFKMLRKVLDK